ncbi:APC family permease [Streptomyces sp. NPDC005722]
MDTHVPPVRPERVAPPAAGPSQALAPAPSLSPSLSPSRATAHYIGALFGPSLLLLPGLAVRDGGPASVLAWGALLVLSALIAVVFSGLGTRFGSSAGVTGYAAAGLGRRAGRATGWCFFAGVVAGVPVVCLIGGQYLAAVAGVPRHGTAAAAGLLVLVLVMRLAGARTGSRLQSMLVALLLVLLAVAVLGTLGSARAAAWHPFAPNGVHGVFTAAGHLMLAFVGWEAAAPLTARLPDARRQLPRVITAAFLVTAVGYLALAVTTIAVLGPAAGSTTPLADLLRVAVGPWGAYLAAATAVLLTLGVTNAYLQGAAATADHLLRVPGAPARGDRQLPLTVGVAAFGALLLGLSALSVVDLSALVALPTALFLLVYLACTVAATRALRGLPRAAAAVASAVVVALLVAAGPVTVVALAVAVAAVACPAPGRRPLADSGRG